MLLGINKSFYLPSSFLKVGKKQKRSQSKRFQQTADYGKSSPESEIAFTSCTTLENEMAKIFAAFFLAIFSLRLQKNVLHFVEIQAMKYEHTKKYNFKNKNRHFLWCCKPSVFTVQWRIFLLLCYTKCYRNHLSMLSQPIQNWESWPIHQRIILPFRVASVGCTNRQRNHVKFSSTGGNAKSCPWGEITSGTSTCWGPTGWEAAWQWTTLRCWWTTRWPRASNALLLHRRPTWAPLGSVLSAGWGRWSVLPP